MAEKHTFSQRKLELINRGEGVLEQVSMETILPFIPLHLKKLLMEHDYEVESNFRERGKPREVLFISCQGLVKKDIIMEQMRDILATIQSEYDYPVDMEFTINLSESGDYVINILQCRPLQVFKDSEHADYPEDVDKDKVIFECRNSAMGLSRSEKLDRIVYVDPENYYNMPYKDKYKVARAIGAINWDMREQNKKMLLLVPGRIGTTSPELGVPTAFADISEFEAICEIADSKAGYNPELSYGSHFFQDLVESGILYNAIFENNKTIIYNRDLMRRFDDISEDKEGLSDILFVYDVSSREVMLCNDMNSNRIICFIKGE